MCVGVCRPAQPRSPPATALTQHGGPAQPQQVSTVFQGSVMSLEIDKDPEKKGLNNKMITRSEDAYSHHNKRTFTIDLRKIFYLELL